MYLKNCVTSISQLEHAHLPDSKEAQQRMNQGLVVIYTFVELNVSPILIDFLTKEEKHELIVAAIRVTNLRDVLSSIFSIVVFPITEAFTGYLAMITVCTAANILGLGLLWTSTSPSAHVEVYAAIFLLALGKSGQKLSEKFFEDQLQETNKEESDVEQGSMQNKEEQDRVGEIRKNVWLVVQSFSSYSIIIVHIALINPDGDYKERFLFAAILMFVMYLLFVIVYCGWYSRKGLAAESNEGKIYGIRKAVSWKWDSKYPSSTAKEEREVKSFIPMCFTFVAYSLLLASGNTFFVVQARRLTPFTRSIGNDISFLFLIKSVVKTSSKYTCKGLGARSKTMFYCGMVCAVICSLRAMAVVFIHPHETVTVIPQFFLLGMTEELVGGRFAKLLHDHLPKSEDLFSELMILIGRLLVFIICEFFKDTVKSSHLGRFYLVLAILNAAFGLFACIISDRYAYNEECQEDEKINVQKTLEKNNETQPVDQVESLAAPLLRVSTKESCIAADPSGGKTHEKVQIVEQTFNNFTQCPKQLVEAVSTKDTEGSSKNIPPKRLEPLSVQPAQVVYPNAFNKQNIRHADNEECQEDEKITEEKTLELHVHEQDSQDSNTENNNGTKPVDQVESHATPPVRVSTKESCATAAAVPLGEETHTGISDMCELYVGEDPPHLVAAADPSRGETHLEPTIQHDMVGMVVEQPDANDQVLVPMPIEGVQTVPETTCGGCLNQVMIEINE